MEQSASYTSIEKPVSAVNAESISPAIRHGRFSPRDLIVEAIDDFVARMADRDISVVSDIFYSVPGTVFGNGRAVRQLLDSVLDNAGTSTRKGRIHIECRFENGFPDPVLVLTVRLTRIGVKVNVTGGAAGVNFFSARIPVTRS